MPIPENIFSDNTVYNVENIDILLNRIHPFAKYVKSGKDLLLNIGVCFDIETTSFYDANNKSAIMYVWTLGIYGLIVMGRTWDEYLRVCDILSKYFRLNDKRRMVIYIHNISFDFAFLHKHHNFIKVFAIDKYVPLYAITDNGIEYRCSYKLSGYNAESLAKNLHNHSIKKLVGDLDYTLIRHNKTPLTQKEIGYCINDVKIICAYITELIEREGGIQNIAYTKTGFVRKYSRDNCLSDKGYKTLIKELTLDAKQFKLCRQAFMGGYTHSNPIHTDYKLKNVASMDIISSYPAVMFDEKYPMSKPEYYTPKDYDDFLEQLNYYCCIFTIEIAPLESKIHFDYYLSASKCDISGYRTISNGRIVRADKIITSITNIDFQIMMEVYKIDKNNIRISDFIRWKKEYLPTPFVKSMLLLYQKKTELKGVKGMEVEYSVMKENQNSYYGMTVTNPIKEGFDYIDSMWVKRAEINMDEAIDIYNRKYNRFLYYPWGVFVTAYARRNIWLAILATKNDHVYTDTDSEKFLNYELHREWFNRYNEMIIDKHKIACKVHGLPLSMCMPKTREGKTKILGAFDFEGIYNNFKTNGAKRYLYEIDENNDETPYGDDFNYSFEHYEMTVAGLSKKKGIQYMIETYDDIFEAFTDDLYVPPEFSGRKTHTYIETPRHGVITDYRGITAEYDELSGVHLESSDYTMGISGDFLLFCTIEHEKYLGVE